MISIKLTKSLESQIKVLSSSIDAYNKFKNY
jgi:hypothetical protein